MTYDGYIVAAANGAVIVVDRNLKVVDYRLFPGEQMENSIAADESNGIYVATSVNMHKLVWTGTALSQDAADGAWSTAYDVMPEGEAQAMGAASHGSAKQHSKPPPPSMEPAYWWSTAPTQNPDPLLWT